MNTFKFTLICFLILIIKTGMSPIGPEYVSWIRDSAITYPDPKHFVISSPGAILLMKILNYPNNFIWWTVCFFIFIFWILITVSFLNTLANKLKMPNNYLILIFFIIPAASIQISMIGHADIFTLLGCSILILGNFRGHAFLGTLVAVSGNQDQAIAVTCCLLIMTISGSKNARKIFPIWGSVSILSYLFIHITLNIPSNNDPKQVMFSDLSTVFKHSLPMWNFLIYGQFGIFWLVIILCIIPLLKSHVKNVFLYFFGSLFIPICMSLFILDGNRVGVCGTFCVTLTLLLDYLDNFHSKNNLLRIESLFIVLFLLYVVTPTINIGNQGTLRVPLVKITSRLLGVD